MQVGLSTIAEKVLGKPLDKSMQLSDWEQRPLSERQMRCEIPKHFMPPTSN